MTLHHAKSRADQDRPDTGAQPTLNHLQALLPLVEPTTEQVRFLDHWEHMLPREKWGPYLIAWARALEDLGTPLNFTDSFHLEDSALCVGAESFPAVRIHSDSSRRHELMKTQKPIALHAPLDGYRGLMNATCFLCQTVGFAQDGVPSGAPNGAILDLGSAFLVPNRYPMAPGHALFLPVYHDPERSTIGRTPTKDELTTLMAVSDGLDLIAMRNHVHDGMSIPAHDHFHLHPADLNILPLLHRIRAEVGEFVWGLRAHVSYETPFQHLVLSAPSHDSLAEAAVDVLNAIDTVNGVYVLGYYRKCLIISHRHPDAYKGTKLTVGGASIGHAENVTSDGRSVIPDPIAVDRDLPRMPNFKESPRFVVRGRPLEAPALYQPIRWDKLQPLGSGTNLRALLAPDEWAIWEELLPLQDQRLDPGHAETVVLFTHLLSEREGLDPAERKLATLAAMVHDTGWARIPNITVEFQKLSQLERDSASNNDAFRERDRSLRIQHQQHSVEIARKSMCHIVTPQELARIELIVGDHDTRQHGSNGAAGAVMWDADMLSRVTVPAAKSLANRLGDISGVVPLLSRWRDVGCYLTGTAKVVAALELENTLRWLRREAPYDYNTSDGPRSWIRDHRMKA